ncbi:integrase catalytic domain-containing protein [Trichonephila clavipes]|nr:integrase catalytic domain-containing protein [Trichonephila clavipes]
MEEIMDFLSKEQIKWNFNPPSPPHFGGLWEAGVKSLKYHLKRVIGNSILSHEEFLTLVVQIEAVLNSRPICPLSNDPNDVETLTPAHFLVGSSLVAVPDPDYTEIPMNILSRWQLVQRMNQHFWLKWSSEYLNRLQQRPKWCKGNVGFKEGDLVLVTPSENSDSLKWHLARILKLHPGKDNIVRVVTLKDKQGIYKRPVTKIANLPYVN